MGYMHINNLYKSQDILLFKECYALEKIHGTSAHITYFSPQYKDASLNIIYKPRELRFFSGGESHEKFVNLFNQVELLEKFNLIGLPIDKDVTIYGEAYGGKQQGMRETYGETLKFIAFDVKINESWLDVPKAESIVKALGLEFVHYIKTNTNIESLNKERDADSTQAIKNGCGAGKKREGVVLRPLIELTKNNGERVICKHKRDDFSEVKTPRPINQEKLQVLTKANEISDEWVTEMRLSHILDKLPSDTGMEKTGEIIKLMIDDIIREGTGEFVDSKEVRAAIGKKTAIMFKNRLKATLCKQSGS